jgi:hypothetical protein
MTQDLLADARTNRGREQAGNQLRSQLHGRSNHAEANPEEASSIVASYSRAQSTVLKVALLSAAVFVLISFCFTSALPGRPMVASD